MAVVSNASICRVFARGAIRLNTVTVEGTVSPGFESVALEELMEKFKRISIQDVTWSSGRIFFNVQLNKFPGVTALRSIDNLAILIFSQIHNFPSVKRQCLRYFENLGWYLNVARFLRAWVKENRRFGEVFPHKAKNAPLRFRVTACRSYTHAFGSVEAAATLGGVLEHRYGWHVDLTRFDLEVLLYIVKDRVTIALKPTIEPIQPRGSMQFEIPTLHATVCYNLLRLADIKPGDIVIDPMCGSGSIPIECGLAYKNARILCGDNNELAVQRTYLNISYLKLKRQIYYTKWDATKLPIADHFVDVIVTNMPCGQRPICRYDQHFLYGKLLVEFARISRLRTARMVLLAYDRRSLKLALEKSRRPYWNMQTKFSITLNGLRPIIYVFKRNAIPYIEL